MKQKSNNSFVHIVIVKEVKNIFIIMFGRFFWEIEILKAHRCLYLLFFLRGAGFFYFYLTQTMLLEFCKVIHLYNICLWSAKTTYFERRQIEVKEKFRALKKARSRRYLAEAITDPFKSDDYCKYTYPNRIPTALRRAVCSRRRSQRKRKQNGVHVFYARRSHLHSKCWRSEVIKPNSVAVSLRLKRKFYTLCMSVL